MRWIIVLVGLGLTACGEMSGSGLGEESEALVQTVSTTWQDERGNVLPAGLVEEAYRACQSSLFGPDRGSVAAVVPLEDQYGALALTNPQFDYCMHSFGYSRVASTAAPPSGTK